MSCRESGGCRCNLCRELGAYKVSRNFLKRSFKNTLAIVGVGRTSFAKEALMKNDNFILKEKQQQQEQDSDCVPEVKIMLNKDSSEVRNNHKTVIYFGDSIARKASPAPADLQEDDMDDDSLKKYEFSSETVTTDSSVSNHGESRDLPSFVDSVVDGVINIKIEGNFQKANELVRKLSMKGNRDNIKPKDYDHFDWGFVQEWRNNRWVIGLTLIFSDYSRQPCC